MLVGPSVRPLVGPSVPISLQKLIMSQLLRAWGLVTTLFIFSEDKGILLCHTIAIDVVLDFRNRKKSALIQVRFKLELDAK
jgi:hypothetical protein